MLKFILIALHLSITIDLATSDQYDRFSSARANSDSEIPKFSENEKKLKTIPQDLMIDLTNEFGLKILYLHSVANKNNVAFSPCGLTSVLVALFEGADGKSAFEIHSALNLPWERDLVRIGFRDIHRRLRTYFYRNENILSGLSLSRDNITFRSDYETILRFYGYEVSSLPMAATTVINNDTVMMNSSESTLTDMVMTPGKMDEEVASTEKGDDETTTESNDDTTKTPSETPMTNGSVIGEPLINETTTEMDLTTKIVGETMPNITTEVVGTESTTKSNAVSSKPTSTTELFTDKETTIDPFMESKTMQTTMASLGEELEEEVAEYDEYNDVSLMTTENVAYDTEAAENITSSSTTRSPTSATKRRIQRSAMEYEIISNYEIPQQPEYTLDFDTLPHPLQQPQFNDYDGDNFKSESPETDLTHLFYLTHFEPIHVPYKFYNTIVKYAYIEELRSSAIELQLDSKNYNMLILLPDYEYGLENLLYTMNLKTTLKLRDIKKQLKLAWIKAIVPKFNLKGNIILTSDLQNLGVIDIFEPTLADFTPMTDDELVYTRHIEQSVVVNIRTQRTEQMLRQSFFKSPVEISVNHPFLFFVIDTEIDLAIIAGRVLNPLNARIQ